MNQICDKCKYVSGFSSEFPCNRCVVIAINCFVPNNAALNSEELAATVPAVAAANTASPKFPQIEEMFKELSFLAYGPLNGRETNLVLSTVNFIERKLRA